MSFSAMSELTESVCHFGVGDSLTQLHSGDYQFTFNLASFFFFISVVSSLSLMNNEFQLPHEELLLSWWFSSERQYYLIIVHTRGSAFHQFL